MASRDKVKMDDKKFMVLSAFSINSGETSIKQGAAGPQFPKVDPINRNTGEMVM